MPTACAVADWTTVLRAAEVLRFSRVTPWDHTSLYYCEFYVESGRLVRDIIINESEVTTMADADV